MPAAETSGPNEPHLFMSSEQKKSDFSARLRFALKRHNSPVKGATDLARHFNLRHPGASVSVQTTHKWLTGQSMPTDDKIKTLAAWLNVTEHWLHYGPPPSEPMISPARQHLLSSGTLALAEKIEALPEPLRYSVEALVSHCAMAH